MKVGDIITYNGPPPPRWWETLLWRLFSINVKRASRPQKAVVVEVATSSENGDR
jgi:hypothetical protein